MDDVGTVRVVPDSVSDVMKLRVVLRNTGVIEAYCRAFHDFVRWHSHTTPLRAANVYRIREQWAQGSTSLCRYVDQPCNRPIRRVFGGREQSVQFHVQVFRMMPTRFRALTAEDVGKQVFVPSRDTHTTAPFTRSYSIFVDMLDLPDTDFTCVGALSGFRRAEAESARRVWQNEWREAVVVAEDGTAVTYSAMLADSCRKPTAGCLRENRHTKLCVQVFCETCSSYLPLVCVDDESGDGDMAGVMAGMLKDATRQITRHMQCASSVSSLEVVCG